jgi:3-oxoacyl-[acyl-carrier-protein] synthase II
VFPNTVYNAAGGQVAIKVGALGPASTICTGHSAGAAAIAYGYDLAASNAADAVISIGADALTDTVIEAYGALGLLASAPPGLDGAGFALAEAGVALVVERLGHARARGATAYGEILGCAITSDARGVGRIDTEGEGVERAMRAALDHAGVDPGDVVAVWSSQTGLEVADEAERKAIERVLGGDVPILAPKLRLGEPMGAGASLAAALALKGWERSADDLSPRGPVVVNSLSLGGTNYSLVLAPFSD